MVAVIFLAALVTACATSREVYTSTGELGYSIDCSGTGLDWDMCLEKAGRLCPEQGFEILQTSSDIGYFSFQESSSNASSPGIRLKNRNMIITCDN